MFEFYNNKKVNYPVACSEWRIAFGRGTPEYSLLKKYYILQRKVLRQKFCHVYENRLYPDLCQLNKKESSFKKKNPLGSFRNRSLAKIDHTNQFFLRCSLKKLSWMFSQNSQENTSGDHLYVRNIFRKTNMSYPLIRTRKFAYVLNEWYPERGIF